MLFLSILKGFLQAAASPLVRSHHGRFPNPKQCLAINQLGIKPVTGYLKEKKKGPARAQLGQVQFKLAALHQLLSKLALQDYKKDE